MDRTIAIIGGGITGLAAAVRIKSRSPNTRVQVFESQRDAGGVLRSERVNGFLIEQAADSFLTTPGNAVELCHHLGLDAQLIPTNNSERRTYVVRQGKLQAIPDGFAVMAPTRILPFLKSPLLSIRAKLRAAIEPLIPRSATGQDETIGSFVCRLLGRELYDRLIQPLAGSIYAADARRLSVRATMPRFAEMERTHRSLLLGMALYRRETPKPASNIPHSHFLSLRDGMGTLVAALERQLPTGTIHNSSHVLEVHRLEYDRWQLEIGGESPTRIDVDGVILATPAYQSSILLRHVDSSASEELRQIAYSRFAVVSLGFARHQITHPMYGHGFVVPLIENRCILSCSFSSVKFENRAPDSQVLLRVFVGGACQQGLLALGKEQIAELAEREVANLLGIRGEATLRHVTLHDRSTPQFNQGHLDRVARIRDRLQSFPTLQLACSALGGVGIPACVRTAYQAADDLITHFPQTSHLQCSEPALRAPFQETYQ